MKTYLWKKVVELKKSILKCFLLIVLPFVVSFLFSKLFVLNQNWFYFVFPITISSLNYYITYNVDDIACASTYALVGIPQKAVWMGNIVFCMGIGYGVSVVVEIVGNILHFHSLNGMWLPLTFLSLPCAFAIIGLSTVHYLTNSKKEMIVASVFAILCLSGIPIAILINHFFELKQCNIIMYLALAIIFSGASFGTWRYMGKEGKIETLVKNSKIYIKGYDKNFFMEE